METCVFYTFVTLIVLVVSIILYKLCSVRFVQYRDKSVALRVGFSDYIAKGNKVYEVSDDFAYHEELVQSLEYEKYILSIIEQNKSLTPESSKIVKRFLRKAYIWY